jgi:pyroglutamyl-peptidase
MPQRRPIVLLTGFGPFPGVPENASAELVTRLAARLRGRLPGHDVEAEVLPTEWSAAPLRVAQLLSELKPVVALHFGVSSKATGIVVEVRGSNLARPLADAAGRLPESDRLSPDGPDHLAASIPAAHIVARLRQRLLPASLSRDAGGYLCNAVLYRSLEQARRAAWPVRSGFLHVPATLGRPQPLVNGARCGLDWSQAIEGSLEVVTVSLGLPRGISAICR